MGGSGRGQRATTAVILAAYTPVLHLRRVDGAYFSTYLESFERVWGLARDLPENEPAGATP